MREMIWYQNLGGFITNENYFIVLPTQNMTLEERINAIMRFFIYLGVILAVLRGSYKYLFLGIFAGVISVGLYEFEQQQKARAEAFLQSKDLDIVDNRVCARSTVDNPFMNPSIADISDNPDRPAACSVEKVQDVIESNFEARLFRDVGDIYGRESSQRQFYTMPATTIPNNQEDFAKWCYGTGPTCKEGNGGRCYDLLMEDVQRKTGMNS